MYYIDMRRKGKVVYDAVINQSLDNYFANDLRLPGHGFMLYQNQPSVIIGKYQNAWAEVDMKYLREHNIQLVRRTSGGGAVYHDLGNLIFENIYVNNDDHFGDYGFYAAPILNALKKLGINAQMKQRSSDLIVEDKKFSGMTMFKSGHDIAAGGTLMYDLNIENAKKVLTQNQPEKAKRLGVRSVKSPMINLKQFLPQDWTINDFREYILKEVFAVKSLDDIEVYHMTDEDWAKVDQRIEEKYGTDEWNYGENPGYDHYADAILDGKKLAINFTIDKGRISQFKINPFFDDQEKLSVIEQRVTGKKPTERVIKKAVSKSKIQDVDQDELSQFIFENLNNK